MIINPNETRTRRVDRPADTQGEVTTSPLPQASLAIPLYILAVLAVLACLYAARVIAFPVVLGLVLAFPLRPVVRWLSRFGLPKVIGASLIIALVALALIAAAALVIAPASQWIDDAPRHLRRAELKLRSFSESFEEVGKASQQVEEMAESAKDSDTIKVSVQQPSVMSTVLSTTGNLLLTGSVVVTLTFLLLVFGDDLVHSVASLAPASSTNGNVRDMCESVERTISRYLFTHSAINIGLGIVIGTGMWLIGMPNALLWGVMACLFNYVPFIGLISGTIIVAFVALLSFDSMLYACLAPRSTLEQTASRSTWSPPPYLARPCD